MNDTFEDRLLTELKSEISARAAQGHASRRLGLNRRRIVGTAAIAGLAAAAAFAVSLVAVPQTPAYALTRGAHGTINLRINEFRDPDQIEDDLGRLGITADITYLPLGKRCGNERAPVIPGDRNGAPIEDLKSKDPAVRARAIKQASSTPSAKAIRPENGITIYPQYIKKGQIAMIEVEENQKKPTLEHPGVVWQFFGRLTNGPIAPCQIVDDPSAFDIGTAPPPAGS